MKKVLILIMLSFSIVVTSCSKSEIVSENIYSKSDKEIVPYDELMYNMENPRDLPKLKSPISQTDPTLLYTVCEITLYDVGDYDLINECFSLISYYEDILSGNIKEAQTSYVYKLNNSNGEPVEFSDDALECLLYGSEYSKNYPDTFDITIGALTNLWDINNATTAPSDEDINKALSTVAYDNIIIDGNSVSLKNPDTQIDLGGIAKGFIADKVCEYLISQGVNSAIINLGGNIYTLGYKDPYAKTNFNIGIKKPEFDSSEQIGYVSVNNTSIVSSGGYEQYFVDENTGKIYSHILDKNTGYPVETDISQITILSEKSVDGDGLSTSLYPMGSDKAMEIIESLDNTECIIVTNDGDILLSSGISESDDSKIKFTRY